MKKINIYVLELIMNKFYVGKTSKDVKLRFNQHVKGKGAIWTKMFKPIKIIESYETTNDFEEDMITKKYMNKYGIENVRGGSYVQINLEPNQIKFIEQELKSSNNLCFICGSSKHFAVKCPNKKFE
jgi:predicted GIY-YIG superfamily endonuclease